MRKSCVLNVNMVCTRSLFYTHLLIVFLWVWESLRLIRCLVQSFCTSLCTGFCFFITCKDVVLHSFHSANNEYYYLNKLGVVV